MKVWIYRESLEGGPDYSICGVFTSRESALAKAGGEIHPLAGKQQSHGGIGWKLPSGGRAWSEDSEGNLMTFDAVIEQYALQGIIDATH